MRCFSCVLSNSKKQHLQSNEIMLHSASVAFLAFYPMAKNNTHKAMKLCYTVPQLLFLRSIQWQKTTPTKQ
jgi:hypothetical protein